MAIVITAQLRLRSHSWSRGSFDLALSFLLHFNCWQVISTLSYMLRFFNLM